MSNLKEELNKLIAKPNDIEKNWKIGEFVLKLVQEWLFDSKLIYDEFAYNNFHAIIYDFCYDNMIIDYLRARTYHSEYKKWFVKKFDN